MIIEQNGEALKLDDAPFRVYATQEEFKQLSSQALEAKRKVQVGWVELNPQDATHKVSTKPQDPTIKDWVS